MILGGRLPPDDAVGGPDRSEPAQSVLTYNRPLRDRESVTYEFLYEPGRTEVHPALDRLALLLEPNGVRLHWMASDFTDGSGLRADNVADEPACRRGPRPLPLKLGGWNAVWVALTEGTVTIELNGVLIYERRLEAANDRRFGLYHDKGRTDVRIRAAVLRGDWPESLSVEQLAHLFAPSLRRQPGRPPGTARS